MFAACFFDKSSSSYILSQNKNSVLYVLLIPKIDPKIFDLFYLPKHNPLSVVYQLKNEYFHPRTVGRQSAGMPTTIVYKSPEDVTQREVMSMDIKNAYKKGLLFDETLLSDNDRTEYRNIKERINELKGKEKPTSDEIRELHNLAEYGIFDIERKAMRLSPQKAVSVSKKEFLNAKCFDINQLSKEEQEEYKRLNSKIALRQDAHEIERFETLKRKGRIPSCKLTLEDMKDVFEYSDDYTYREVSNFNEDDIILPLLKTLAENMVILSIDNQPIDFKMEIPTTYTSAKAISLQQNQRSLYEREIKLSMQKNYPKNPKAAHFDTSIFEESPRAYKEGQIHFIDKKIETIRKIINRMAEDLSLKIKELEEKQNHELRAYEKEIEDLEQEKEMLKAR